MNSISVFFESDIIQKAAEKARMQRNKGWKREVCKWIGTASSSSLGTGVSTKLIRQTWNPITIREEEHNKKC